MDSRNALVAFAAYVGVALVLAAVCMAAVLWFGVPSRLLPADVTRSVAESSTPQTAVPQRAGVMIPPAAATANDSTAQRQIRLLESIVDEKNKRLRDLAERLAAAKSDLAQLQTQYETETAVMMDVFGASPDTGAPEEDAIKDKPTVTVSARDKLDAELAIAEAAQKKLLTDMEALQAKLEKANQDLSELQIQSLTDAAGAETRVNRLEAAMVGLLQNIGTAAVPHLTRSLNDANPDVRRWAAEALGELGPDAGEAVAALTELLSDDNERVRLAAKTALESIGR